MELKKDPELMFLEDCVRFLAELNDKTRALQLEYDILIGKLVPPPPVKVETAFDYLTLPHESAPPKTMEREKP